MTKHASAATDRDATTAPVPTRFVLLGKGRTGSTMLIQALNSHPDIRCFGAIFNRQVDFVDYSVDGYNNDDQSGRRLRDSDAIAFLEKRIFSASGTMPAAVGFKYRYGQEKAFPGLLDYLVRDTHLHVVHLQRRNVLRSMISARIANSTGVWFQQAAATPAKPRRPRLTVAGAARALRDPARAFRSIRGLTPAPQPAWKRWRQPVSLSIEECLTEFQTIEQQVSQHEQLFLDHPNITVLYEDFLTDRDGAFRRVQDFLGVEKRPLTVTLMRQNPEPLRTLIANYDELYRAFQDTPAAAFFD